MHVQHVSKVLLVEDEMMLMMMVEDLLLAEGYDVVTAGRLPPALEVARNLDLDLDAAVLDVNLCGESAIPLADELSQRGVPIVFASGYGAAILPDRYRTHPMLQKPYLPQELLVALEDVLHP